MSTIDPPAGWDEVDGINTSERLLGGPAGPLNRAATGLTARTKQLRDWRETDQSLQRQLESEVSTVVATPVAALGDIQTIQSESGALFDFNGTQLRVAQAPVRVSSYPVIPAYAGRFAVPVADHVVDAYGAFGDRGVITSASDWAASNGRQLQGMEFDARAGTVILASVSTTASPESALLIEYAYSSAGIGSEVMRTGDLGIGHGEYFVIDYTPGGGRKLWSGGSTAGQLRRWPLVAGATAPDLTIDMAVLTSSFVTVWGYDEKSVCVRFVRSDVAVDTVHVCDLTDLNLGTFDPIFTFPATQMDGLWPILPTQMVRGVGSVMTGLAGYVPTQTYRATAGWIDSRDGSVIAQRPLNLPGAALGDEVEGVGFWWAAGKFETVAAIWRPSGSVYLVSLTDPRVSQTATSPAVTLLQETFSPGPITMASQQNGKSRRYLSPAPVGATALFVGGENRSLANTFSYNDMFIEQVENNSTRQGARVRLWNAMELKWDGPSDTSFPPGLRYYVNSTAPTSFHAVSGGLRVGGQYSTGFTGAYGALHAIGNSVRQVGGQFSSFSASYPALLLQAAVDIACPAGEAIGFGEANVPAGTVTSWYSMGSAAFNPSTDNTRSLGTSANRWSVVYANTGTINTSDAREKTSVRDLEDKELACANDLLSALGGFKFLASVEEKGAKAREHIGMTVQRAIAIMVSHGLDPFNYAFICHDTWAAGDRFSFRENELHAFLLKALHVRLSRLESALTS